MGNSPSSLKNESSQSLQSTSSSSSGSGEVLEPDPRKLPSHPKRLAASSLTKRYSPTLTASNVTNGGKSSSSSPKDDLSSSFDLEIATSMAYALNINKSNVSSSSDDIVSSSLGSDASLLTGSSISSISSSTPTALVKNLEPIDEASLEGTPEPSKAHRRKIKTTSNDEFDIDSVIESLIETGLSRSYSRKLPVTILQIQYICSKAREIFLSQPMLLELAAPVKVVGDIHGQFYDLLRILKLCGFPPESNYLFLGDYVDRGKQSLETLLLLLCFKIKYPENFFLLRGNHECASVTKMYGFYDECKRRSSTKNWKCFVDVFNTLPVAATIGDKIFCVHGGLSPSLHNFNQIKNITRPSDVPDEGLLSDLLWSDPDPLTTSWNENDRGVSYTFGADIVNKFLKTHHLDLIVRAHMVVEDGYEFFAKRKLVTVFSAPNYCGEFDNWGAVMNVNKNLVCSFEMLKPVEKSYGSGNSNEKK